MSLDKAIAKEMKRLAKDVEKFDKALRKAASDAAVAMTVAVVEALAHRTPVDTSKALSNWQASAGFPKTREIPAHYPGDGGSTYVASAQETAEKAMDALARKKMGQEIFITNNVSYMEELAKGSSPQADRGWIEAVSGMVVRKKNWMGKWPIM